MLVKEVKMWRQGTPLGLSNEELIYRAVFAIRNAFFFLPDPIFRLLRIRAGSKNDTKLGEK
jgi:hypothetical protein